MIHPQLTSCSLNRIPLKELFPVDTAMLPVTGARWEEPLPDAQCFGSASSPASSLGEDRLVDAGVALKGRRGSPRGRDVRGAAVPATGRKPREVVGLE